MLRQRRRVWEGGFWLIVIKMKVDIIEEKVELPEDVKFSYEKGMARVEGPKGSVEKRLLNPKVSIALDNNRIKIFAKKATKREKKIIGSFRSHISNMIEGVQNGFVYKLKICSGHFPMSVGVKGDEFIVKNFTGERIPRVLKLKPGVDVKVEGDIVVVSSVNKELAGQTAASIEQLTRRPGYDKRIFQDGIYIIEKAGKEIR